METAEKKIRSYIRISKATRIVLLCWLAVTALLVLAGTVLKLNKDKAPSEQFDAMVPEKDVFSHIDVVGVSDWLYSYTYNDAKETFYIVLDTDGYWNFATIDDKDIARMSAQRLYWDGKTDTAPEPYRIQGVSWPLNASARTRAELYKLSGAESEEEFENWFGQMYLLKGNNPIFELGAGFHLAALFLGLFWAIVLLCCSPKMIKTGKSIRAMKKAGELIDAANELKEETAIGPCIIGETYFFVRRQGIAVPLSGIKSVTGYANSIRMKTDVLGDIVVTDLKQDVAQAVFDALPIEAGTVEVVRTKTR